MLARSALLRAMTLLLFAFALWIPTTVPVSAQEPAAAPAEVSSATIEELVADLEDPERRNRLVSDLRAMLAAQEAADQQVVEERAEPRGLGGQLMALVSQNIQDLNEEFAEAAEAMLELPALAWELVERGQDTAVLLGWGEMAAKVILVLAAGFLAEWVVRRLLGRPRRTLEDRGADHIGLRAVFLVARTVLDLIPVAAFAAAAYGLLPLTEPQYVTQLVALALINANVLARVVLALARLVLVPGVPALRLLPLDDESVQYLYIWARRIVRLSVYGYFILEAALLMGLPESLYTFLMKFLGLVITAMAVILVLQNRGDVAAWLRAERKEPGENGEGEEKPKRAAAATKLRERPEMKAIGALRRRFADIWHVVAVALIIALYATWALEVDGGFEFLARAIVMTLVVVFLAVLANRLAQRGVDRLFMISGELKAAYPGLEERANRYQPIIRQTLRAVILVVAAFAVLQAWGLGTLSWLFSPQGGMIVGDLVTLALIIAVAFAIWEVVSAMIERSLAREAANGAAGSTRKLTLLPLLRNVVRITLVLIATMIVMSHLGIDIGPLLAGAGVIGLAVGFGAQTLVRDVITGAFILVEDAIAVGDWVEAGGHSGTVENLTVRTVTLRDLNGTVHVVPFGDVTSVSNYNRDYGYAVIDAGVAYRESYAEVVEALQDVAIELRADETWGSEIIGDLELFGLNKLGDSSIEVRVRLKTRPMRQFAVRRAFQERMKRVFDEREIEIPFPHQTIWFGQQKDGSAPPVRIAEEAPPQLTAAPTSERSTEEDVAERPGIRIASEVDASQDVLHEKEKAEQEQAEEERRRKLEGEEGGEETRRKPEEDPKRRE